MQKHFQNAGLIFTLGALVVGCTDLKPQSDTLRYPYTFTVDLQSTDSKESLEQQYKAPVLLFDAEEGYAVLGLQKSNAAAMPQAINGLESNIGVVQTDQVTQTDGSLGVWADGSLGVWADGSLGLWADGSLGIWADGSLGVWADGRFAPIPNNTNAWKSIALEQGQTLAKNMGKNITIAVIDSGIDLNHPAFKRSLVAASMMRDFVDGDNVPNDTINGHGTAVAGVMLQVAPGAQILPIRVIGNDGKGDADKLAQAIQYAVSSKADVINISLSVLGVSTPVKRALDAAGKAKIPVFLSAGNTAGAVGFPGVLAVGPASIVNVGSLDARGVKSVFSSFGANLELSAPGERLTTAFPNNRSIVASGTSMATAVASGAVALALAEKVPTDTSTVARQTWMTADKSIYTLPENLLYTYPKPDSQGYLGTIGYKGRLNVEYYLKTVLK